MKLLRLICSESPSWAILAAAVGLLSGIGNAASIAFAQRAISEGRPADISLFWIFVALCLSVPIGRVLSQYLLMRATERLMLQMIIRISRQMLATPLRQLEAIGHARIMTVLTDDLSAINTGVLTIPPLLLNAAVVIGSITNLAVTSTSGAALVGILTVVCVVSGYGIFRFAKMSQMSARKDLDSLFAAFRSNVEGIKELKLHRSRRQDHLQHLRKAGLSYRNHNLRINLIYTAGSQWLQVLFLLPVGVLVFALPTLYGVPMRSVAGYSLVLLFIMSPVGSLSGLFQNIGRATTAVRNMESLGLQLSTDLPDTQEDHSQHDWDVIQLRGVTHETLASNKDNVFVLGPIDLTLRRGELLFISGGNGSGKTTFAKLLCGLYEPTSGTILVDGNVVKPEQMDNYRERFAAVFTDFYLFDRLFGMTGDDLDERAGTLLNTLALSGIVRVQDSRITPIELSRGQRKRLALMVALLEQRDILVLDEWAADQDKSYREKFYVELLPELQRQGKTIVVITHDERYFHLADRLITFEYGKVSDGAALLASSTAYGRT